MATPNFAIPNNDQLSENFIKLSWHLIEFPQFYAYHIVFMEGIFAGFVFTDWYGLSKTHDIQISSSSCLNCPQSCQVGLTNI